MNNPSFSSNQVQHSLMVPISTQMVGAFNFQAQDFQAYKPQWKFQPSFKSNNGSSKLTLFTFQKPFNTPHKVSICSVNREKQVQLMNPTLQLAALPPPDLQWNTRYKKTKAYQTSPKENLHRSVLYQPYKRQT
jgi:hypothetical protein